MKHRSGLSSQLSGPIAGFLACVEDAQRLQLPSTPSPRRGPTGLHRTQFQKTKKNKSQKSDCSNFSGFPFSRLTDNCMIFVALIPVMNYNAQIAFKKRIANGDLWLCTCQHERTRSRLAGTVNTEPLPASLGFTASRSNISATKRLIPP